MKIFQWAVVGAGPAGIAAIGKLIDLGVAPADILWLDPEFNVGDLGLYWSSVSSNTKVQLFLNFLTASKAFAYSQTSTHFAINHLPADKTCSLSYIVEPLSWITQHLRKQVHSEIALIRNMKLADRRWTLSTDTKDYQAQQVILATGAVPNVLNHPTLDVIPFHTAIDQHKLSSQINTNETYAVFGSSHSAIIIIKHLVELGVKKIHNFYRSPCCYAIDMDDWILFDNTGLKGNTAQWARQHIDGVWPANLMRHNSSEPSLERYLPECDKVIYAVGFTKRDTIAIDHYEHKNYNPYVGIIGPGLFGLGIAYPEIKPDLFGNIEAQVGLWKFMVYLNKVMPIWFKYHT